MKKQLLAGAFVLASFLTAQAQTETHDFNDLDVDVLSTDITTGAPGQGGWVVFADNGATGTTTDNMDSSAAQIVAGDSAHGNVLEIAGPNGDAGFAAALLPTADFYEGPANDGNTTFSVQFDYYTGTADAATKNLFSVTSYGITGTAAPYNFFALGGFAIDPTTQEIYGEAYFDADDTNPAGTGYIRLSETAGETYVLPENTWVTLAYSYDGLTGDLEFKGTANGEVLFGASFGGASEAADQLLPEQVEFSVTNIAADNAVSVTRQFDNVSLTANTTGILSTKPVQVATAFSLTPNPTSNVVNIANDQNALLNGVTVTDLNGRTVKTAKFAGVAEAQVNVSDLASGVYMMTISSDKGSVTKKIVKN